MKILRIVSLGYAGGGVENGVAISNSILRAHGHEVIVISGNGRPDLPHYSDYEFKDVPNHGLKQLVYTACNYSSYKVTKQVLADFEPDVVLLHTMAQTTASVLFLLKDYPTILFVHGPEVFTTSLLPWFLPRTDYKNNSYQIHDLTISGRLHYNYFRHICRPLYRRGLRNVNRIVALSHYTKRMLAQDGLMATYIPNGAELLEPRPLNSSHASLLYAGRLEKYKGVDDLIQAMPNIIDAVPQVKLEIAGTGSFSRQLVALVQKLGLTDSVSFLGQLSSAELSQAYVRNSVFVLPSTWPETFGKVGIEAMSSGRPVVATDVGGVTDWLEDGVNGFLVAPHHPEQIAERAVTLLTDKKRAQEMANAARVTAIRFSIEQMTAHIELLLVNVVPAKNQ